MEAINLECKKSGGRIAAVVVASFLAARKGAAWDKKRCFLRGTRFRKGETIGKDTETYRKGIALRIGRKEMWSY